MESNIILEGNTKNSIKPVSLEEMFRITQQMQYSICKIYKKETTGTGFICKLPYNSFKIPFLITNNHILNEKDIEKDKQITISFNNEEKFMNIIIDESRITLTNKDLDITLIEIKDTEKKYYKNKNNDVINLKILEVDQNYKKIDEHSLNKPYLNKPIYALHYPKDDKMAVSFGLIKSINKEKDKDKLKVQHSCCTEDGSSGAPILRLTNFEVVGIHYGSSNNNDFNEGTFIKSIISELEKYEFSRNENNKLSQLTVNDNLINNNINNNINNFTEKIISKNEYSQTILSFPEENCHRFNIIFEEPSNFKTVIIIPSNKDVSKLFDIYKRNRKVKDISNDEILFVYNGFFIKINQNMKISDVFLNNSILTVIDKK
jgi:V8-like Glu-specific endopeptidase